MLSRVSSQRILVSISIPVSVLVLMVGLLALVLYAPVRADDGGAPDGGQYPLIVGTSLNPTGTNHDVFEIDVVANTSQSLLPGFPVGGATYDAANDRVLFTSSSGSTNIDQLWEWPVGGTLNNLGTIMDATAGGAQRIDGLAISGGVLYGSYAGGTAEDGLWTIDTTTLAATLVYPYTDSISGIDADPNTGTIYGVNDTTGNLVSIDPAGSMSVVTAYPAGQADIDGLAVSDDGRAYLIIDEPGSLYVYNLVSAAYETPLNAPWTSADTFSGGAYIASPAQPGVAVSKSPISQTVTTNGIANFTIDITNTGNVTLTTVTAVDALVPDCDTVINDLPPGGTSSYTCSDITVTASYTNTIIVTGTVPNVPDVGASDTAYVQYTSPTGVSLTSFGADSLGHIQVWVLALIGAGLLAAGAFLAHQRRRLS